MLPSGYVQPEWQALNIFLCNAPLTSFTVFNFAVFSICIPTARFSSFLSSLFITLACFSQMLFFSFPTLSLFFFLCFLLSPLPRHWLTLTLLFAIFSCPPQKDSTQAVSYNTISPSSNTSLPMWIPGHSHWHPRVRSGLFCLSLWSSTQLPSSHLPWFCLVSFLVPSEYLRAGLSCLSSFALRSFISDILKASENSCGQISVWIFGLEAYFHKKILYHYLFILLQKRGTLSHG